MLEALQKDSPAVRIAALDTLERVADPATYPEVAKLLRDGSASVRAAAVEAATRCGGRRAVPELLKALKDTSWEVRRAAAKALGFIGETSAVPGLCDLLHDPDHDVREAGIMALGQIGDMSALAALVTGLLDEERTVRNLAQATLRKLNKDWEQAAQVQEVLPAIQSALSHPDYWVRYSATQLLEQLKIDAASFADAAKTAPTLVVETAPPHVALPFLADLLFDRDRDLRVAAAEALGRLRERGATSVLAAAARDADHAVQQAAHAALTALN
jgi:HEAT repeat protein